MYFWWENTTLSDADFLVFVVSRNKSQLSVVFCCLANLVLQNMARPLANRNKPMPK